MMEHGEEGQELVFFVNGNKVVEKNPEPENTLLGYLRRSLLLPGTKEGCGHGGCGSCTVMISRFDHTTQSLVHYTVNACLFPLCAVHGLAVTTVEGVGNPRTGLHEVQKRLIESHGLQCGFCTPGFVMSIFTLLRNNPTPSKDELERAIEGNLCRCTGYRPIVEAFKTMTKEGCPMGEDCCRNQADAPVADKGSEKDGNTASLQVAIFPAELKLSDQYGRGTVSFKGKRWTWIRPTTLAELLVLKNKHPHAPVIMGNTTAALHLKIGRFNDSSVLLYGGNIPVLKAFDVCEEGVVLGAALTMRELRNVIITLSKQIEEVKRKHFTSILEMLDRYGADQIRNVATLSGSLLSGRSNSDVITLLTALGTRMTLKSADSERTVTIDERPKSGEVVTTIHIPHSTKEDHAMFFKQAERATFSLAIINAGMFVRFSENNAVAALKLCFGGIGETVLSASNTTKAAVGRAWTNELLSVILQGLTEEIGYNDENQDRKYKQTLALSFFYRFYLSVLKSRDGELLDTQEVDAVEVTPTVPCEGLQLYDPCTNENQPETDGVGKPLMNVASESLVSGEGLFLDDIPRSDGELFLAPVCSTRVHARIISVDPSKALAVDGVHGYVDYTDIPGDRTFDGDELFASQEVNWYGQLIGGVVAESREVARRASYLVEVKYEDLDAILTLKEAMEKKWMFDKLSMHLQDGDLETAVASSDCVVEGEYYVGPQEHFYMETHCALARPISEGGEMEVIASSQSLMSLQATIASFLDIPSSKVVCKVKRLGGAFGGKETRPVLAAVPAVIAANKHKRPVRCVLSREVDMAITGKRHPFLGRYKAGASKEGKLNALQMEMYVKAGFTADHAPGILGTAMLTLEAGLKIPNVDIHGHVCRTNTPPNTAMRGFGGPESCTLVEDVIFNIACQLGISQDKIRQMNLYKEGDLTAYHMPLIDCTLEALWRQCQQQCDYTGRLNALTEFNRTHRWKKRGIAMTTEKFLVGFGGPLLYQGSALVHIYKDGSVRLSHGGIEMGQGINTKMIQIASRELGVPVGKIFISEASTATEANNTFTAGSTGTDLFGPAVLDACQILSERLKPIKEKNSSATWEELISKAYFARVKLSATGFSRKDREKYFDGRSMRGHACDYFTYGVACSELEIDVLTGQHQVLRTDIVMDIGKSLNPAIDIGQIEGGFVQGMGMMTTEETGIDQEGRTTNCSPLTYKIPNVRSIPRQFNVTLMKNPGIVTTVYSSKAIGEPPLLLSISVLMAIKEAVHAARAEIGLQGYFRLDSPATVAKIQEACGDQLQFIKK